jgi:hypothetical protein
LSDILRTSLSIPFTKPKVWRCQSVWVFNGRNCTFKIYKSPSFNYGFITHIICFKIKNPPTLHCPSKIQPTTSPTFVLSVSVYQKKLGLWKKTVDSRFGRSSSCFLFSFYILLKRYDMVATTFLHIIIILC